MTARQTRSLSIALQVLAWVAFLLLPGVFKPNATTFWDLWLDLFRPIRLISAAFCIGAFYLTYLHLVPQVLVPRRYGLLLLWVLGIGFGYTAVHLGFQRMGWDGPRRVFQDSPQPGVPPAPGSFGPGGPAPAQPGPGFQGQQPGPRRHSPGLFNSFGPGAPLYQLLISLGAAFALGLAREWRREREQRLATEVAFLKAQINPHFLFNTLNTLYALTLAKSDDAPEAVLRLSAIMRYAVAQAGQALVPLHEELAYLEGYLELQRLRLPPAMELRYSFPDEAGRTLRIAPLLLVIPIENAFTHGVGQEEAGRIDIALATDGPVLTLIAENDLPRAKAQPHLASNTGTGLERLRTYLDSRYPAAHSLLINNGPARYRLTLTLRLDA